MKQYPEQLKANRIARMLPPNNVSVPELARETGIPTDSLYTLGRRIQQGQAPAMGQPAAGLSSEEKFNVVLGTATVNEVELVEYCRRKGLFPQQVGPWRELCKQTHEPPAARSIASSCDNRLRTSNN